MTFFGKPHTHNNMIFEANEPNTRLNILLNGKYKFQITFI